MFFWGVLGASLGIFEAMLDEVGFGKWSSGVRFVVLVWVSASPGGHLRGPTTTVTNIGGHLEGSWGSS